MFEHAAQTFQNAIFSQILIQDMQFPLPPQATAMGSHQSLALWEEGVTHCLASSPGRQCQAMGPDAVSVALMTSALLPRLKSRE